MRFIYHFLICSVILLASLNSLFAQQQETTTVGGYGEIHYGYNTETKNAQINLSRFIIFLGHTFDEKISFKSEFEVEDAKVAGGEDGGEVALEQAYLDFKLSEFSTLRAGLFLPAIGIINETHEPPTFNGVERPYLETKFIPATWREIGIGILGTIPSVDGLSYKLYLVNGLNAQGFGGDEGIRGGRFEGREANANSVALEGRLEYVGSGLKLGGAVYYGGSAAGDTSLASGPFGAPVAMEVVDIQYSVDNFFFRGLGALTQIPDAGKINNLYSSDIGKSQIGGYAEIAYNIMPLLCKESTSQLLPFVRYESFDLHSSVEAPLVRNEAYNQHYVILGLTYKPAYNVVVKADYSIEKNKAAIGQSNYFRLGLGYSF